MTVVEAEKFKMTAIGPLPPEWEVVKLGESLDTLRNGTTKRQNKDGKGYAVSRIETISTSLVNPAKVGYIESLTDDEVVNYRLRHGDILFSHINSEPYLGNSAIYKDNPPLLIHGMNLLVVRPNISQLGPEFLNFLFNYYRMTGVFVGIASRAVNQSSINQGKLKALLIPLPSIPEQKEIAAVLSAIQEAKEKTEAVIKALRELKESLTKHLFTYGPVRTDQAKSIPLKETEIGMVPEEWEMVRLGAVCQKTRQADPTRNPGLKFCYIDVSSISRDFLRIADCTEYSGVNAPSRARKVIRQSDVIFATVRPYLKRIAVVPTEFDGQICSTAFCVIRANPTVAYSHYLFYAVSTGPFVQRVSEHQRGSSYPAVTDKDVLKELVPLPSVPTQQQIADILTAVDKKIEAEENKKQALEALFKTLLSRLMTGKIRVSSLEVSV